MADDLAGAGFTDAVEVGRGGFGVVYRCTQKSLDRTVAVKLLHTDLDPVSQERFMREGRAMSRLSGHPNVIDLLHVGVTPSGRPYIVMPFQAMDSLAARVRKRGPVPWREATRLGIRLAGALECAHRLGTLHRDIKPANILLSDYGEPQITDFGIARIEGGFETTTGSFTGSLAYSAPEVLNGRRPTPASDIYALAATLYTIIAGHAPFERRDGEEIIAQFVRIAGQPVPDLRGAGIPDALCSVLERGMAKDPADRPERAEVFGQELQAMLRDAGLPVTEMAMPIARTTDEHETSSLSARPAADPVADEAALPFAVPAPADPIRTDGIGVVDDEADAATTASRGAGVDPALGSMANTEHVRRRPAANGQAEAATAVVNDVPPDRPPAAPVEPRAAPRRRILVIAVAAVLVVLIGAGGYVGLRNLATPAEVAAPAAPSTTAAVGAPATAVPARVASSVPVPSLGQPISVGPTPTFAVASPNGRQVYVANSTAGVITVVDTAVNAVTARIPVSAGPPQFLAFAPDGRRVYVSVWNDARTIHAVCVLDTTTNTIVATIPVSTRPFLAAVTPDDKRLYVPNHDSGTISVIDTATRTVTKEIKVAPDPHWVAFSADGTRAYTADHESNLVSVLDTATDTVIATVPVGTSPHSLAVHPTRPLVANVNYDAASVTEIDTTTDKVVATIPVGRNPQDIAWAPDGRFAYTTNVTDSSVSVIDAATHAVTATIPTGRSPTSIAVLPDGSTGYVTDLDNGTLTVLHLST
ncbi:MAG: protein kinase [Pseudonocardia sp.]|nr:protein kinase [Pseudonocardia sp.]